MALSLGFVRFFRQYLVYAVTKKLQFYSGTSRFKTGRKRFKTIENSQFALNLKYKLIFCIKLNFIYN